MLERFYSETRMKLKIAVQKMLFGPRTDYLNVDGQLGSNGLSATFSILYRTRDFVIVDGYKRIKN